METRTGVRAQANGGNRAATTNRLASSAGAARVAFLSQVPVDRSGEVHINVRRRRQGVGTRRCHRADRPKALQQAAALGLGQAVDTVKRAPAHRPKAPQRCISFAHQQCATMPRWSRGTDRRRSRASPKVLGAPHPSVIKDLPGPREGATA